MKTEDIKTFEEERVRKISFGELLKGNSLAICNNCKYYMVQSDNCETCKVKLNIPL